MITAEEARAAVDGIRLIAHDDEAAHSHEDDLRHAVLIAIAAGSEEWRELARIALSTSDIDFARWCA